MYSISSVTYPQEHFLITILQESTPPNLSQYLIGFLRTVKVTVGVGEALVHTKLISVQNIIEMK
jgi:hypothetical protein